MIHSRQGTLTSNILPPEVRRSLQFEDAYRMIFFFGAGLILALLVGTVLVLPSYLPLYLERKALEGALANEQRTLQKFRVGETLGRMRTATDEVQALRGFAGNSRKASGVLGRFFNNDGITVAALSVDTTGTVSVRGTARTRHNLLDFEKTLRGSGMFQDIISPLANIIQETDAHFTMQGTLKAAYQLSNP